jgi:hypothetical protein
MPQAAWHEYPDSERAEDLGKFLCRAAVLGGAAQITQRVSAELAACSNRQQQEQLLFRAARVCDERGSTPLMVAVEHGHMPGKSREKALLFAQALLSYCTDLLTPPTCGAPWCLHVALAEGNWELATLLLFHAGTGDTVRWTPGPAEYNPSRLRCGSSSLHAVERGSRGMCTAPSCRQGCRVVACPRMVEVVERLTTAGGVELLDAGIGCNHRTALIDAINHSNSTLAVGIVRSCSREQLFRRSARGTTMLVLATRRAVALLPYDDCERRSSLQIVHTLLETGGPEMAGYRCWDGTTALHVAARCGDTRLAGILLRAGGKHLVMQENGFGKLGLELALRGGFCCRGTAALLVEWGGEQIIQEMAASELSEEAAGGLYIALEVCRAKMLAFALGTHWRLGSESSIRLVELIRPCMLELVGRVYLGYSSGSESSPACLSRTSSNATLGYGSGSPDASSGEASSSSSSS